MIRWKTSDLERNYVNDPRLTAHKNTQESYNCLSAWYDLLAKSERRICEKALDILCAQEDDAILDIGSGTGDMLLKLASLVGERGRAAGIDLSTGMMKVARQRLAKNNKVQNVLLSNADAVRLPFGDRSFDAVISTFTVELFDSAEIALVLQECGRVLKSGGRFVLASLNKPSSPNRAVAIYEWFHHAIPQVVDCHPIPVKQHLTQAGFEINHTHRTTLWGLPVYIVLSYKRPGIWQDR